MAAAQHLFETNDPIAKPLKNSAELEKYTVKDVNLNDSMVYVKYDRTIQEVCVSTMFLFLICPLLSKSIEGAF
jgi:hypothetical protein